MATLYKYLTGGREVTFLDPDDVYQPEDIRQHWAATFPELGNAATDNADEQGCRLYAVIGQIYTTPEVGLRVGVYGDFMDLHPGQVFERWTGQ